jgi:histidinol-phosphate aminotransferase
MDVCDLAPGYIRAIAPYQPGKPVAELARELGVADIVKLASNENPLGPSPRALQAIDAALPELARYPDGNGFELKAAIARRHGIGESQIVLGNGSNDVLEMVTRAFLSPGLGAVYARHAFAVYPLAVQAAGARGIEAPAREFGHDLEAMADALDDDTRVVFIANPNNPTGTVVPPGEVRDFLRRLPRSVVAVLDEAYYEYLPDALRANTPAWLGEFPNLVITRTFSKAYGLAALRVGFAMANPAIADLLNRVRQPFNVNTLGQVAAVAALDDQDYVARSVALNRAGMVQLTTGLIEAGLSFIPSYGNFVCVKVANAADTFRRLLAKGVIVRPVANYGLPDYLRVSVGLERENARFLEALREVLG